MTKIKKYIFVLLLELTRFSIPIINHTSEKNMFFVVITNTSDQNNMYEHNNSDEYNSQAIDDDAFYNNMVNRMMNSKSIRGRKRKASSSVKRTKRFKKGKAKK